MEKKKVNKMVIAVSVTKSKICKTCNEEKPLSEFSSCGVTPDKLQPNCKPCHEERKRAGRSAAQVAAKRSEAKGMAAPVLPMPYPGFEEFRGDLDRRSFSKTMANASARMLNEYPDNKEMLSLLEEHSHIANMNDEQFRSHELWEANPTNRLTQDEKLYCIRSLPVAIVKKLFPHL